MPGIPLHHMYRALDRLSKAKEEIEMGLFEYNYIRTNKAVEVVFYDLTTIHFESQLADEELRDFGFSKAGKYNEVQVVLGMIIDANGMPVGYELHKGNTYEGHTIAETLEKIKKRFRIKRVIIVADRGLNNKDGLNKIKEAGCGYIMAAKIKGASAALQKKVFAEDGFIPIHDKNGNLELRYKVMEHENIFKDENGMRHVLQENMVVTYSPKRAKKDKSDRERIIDKAKKLLETPGLIDSTNKRGGRKYVDQTNKDRDKPTYTLAEGKIENDSKFDGYYAIQTSEKSMNAAEVMDRVLDVYKKSFFKQIAFSAIIGLISMILIFVLVFAAVMFTVVPMIIGNVNEETMVFGLFFALIAVMLPLYMIWNATASSGHILLSRQAFCGQRVKLPLSKLPKVVLRVIGVTIAQILLSLPFIAVCLVCVYFLFEFNINTLLFNSLAVMSFFSSTAWIALAITTALAYVVYSNIFALSVPVAVFERRSFFGAVQRSWALIKGKFWEILGLRMLWFIIVSIFNYSAQGIWGIISGVFAVSPMYVFIGGMVSALMMIVIAIVMAPLSGIFPAILYFNQRIKREGLDIEMGLERLYFNRAQS
jgi:hypothetical protein